MRRIPADQSTDSAAVCRHLDRWLANRPELAVISAFAALPGEVDLSECIARHPGRRWVFPKVQGDSLTFHEIVHPSELIPGAFGIREPAPTTPGVDVTEIDLFLCPGLGFDSRGGRLGRGRGFYDRILADARPDALKLGVCHPFQIVADTFPQDHDIMMDGVIS